MDGIILSIVFIFFMAGVFLTWFFSHKARVNERMMLIEKGMDLPARQPTKLFEGNFPWLRIGVVVIGIGLGLIIGEGNGSFVVTIGSIFLCGGIGMFLANFLDRPKVQK